MECNRFGEAEVRLGFSSSDSVCREKLLLTKWFPQDFCSSDVSFIVIEPLGSVIPLPQAHAQHRLAHKGHYLGTPLTSQNIPLPKPDLLQQENQRE